jgi:hypothetical protein
MPPFRKSKTKEISVRSLILNEVRSAQDEGLSLILTERTYKIDCEKQPQIYIIESKKIVKQQQNYHFLHPTVRNLLGILKERGYEIQPNFYSNPSKSR